MLPPFSIKMYIRLSKKKQIYNYFGIDIVWRILRSDICFPTLLLLIYKEK